MAKKKKKKEKENMVMVQWFKLVILATQEAETGFKAILGKKFIRSYINQ
jgi:hypothetical protein